MKKICVIKTSFWLDHVSCLENILLDPTKPTERYHIAFITSYDILTATFTITELQLLPYWYLRFLLRPFAFLQQRCDSTLSHLSCTEKLLTCLRNSVEIVQIFKNVPNTMPDIRSNVHQEHTFISLLCAYHRAKLTQIQHSCVYEHVQWRHKSSLKKV